ncbi:MAG: glutathione peroxidase [Burkholderiaceae bacterium]
MCLASPAQAANCPSWMNVSLQRLQDDQPQAMCQYAGRVLLVVNTASKCGFTPQYEGLEKLHTRLKDRGLTVLGFPSGDFGGQELGSNKQIAEFCENTFGVKFPMFAKSKVKGPGANPVFTHLASATGQAPGWNFHKYLVSRDGSQVLSFDSTVAPDDARLTSALERMLAAPAAKP